MAARKKFNKSAGVAVSVGRAAVAANQSPLGGNGLPTIGQKGRGSSKAVSRTQTAGTALTKTSAQSSADYLRGLAMETYDMAARFDALTYEQAARTVALATRDQMRAFNSYNAASTSMGRLDPIMSSKLAEPPGMTNSARSVRLFIEGDHWQDGHGWVGPMPGPGESSRDIAMCELRRTFVSRNVLSEMVARHTAGCMGHEPHWQLAPRRVMADNSKPTAIEQGLIAEATQALTAWWNQRKVFAFMQDATARLTYQGRSATRLFVPRGLLQPVSKIGDDETDEPALAVVIPAGGGISAALAMLWPDDPYAENARLAEDPDTKRHVGITLYDLGRTIDGLGVGIPFAELTYRGPGDTTILRTMGRDSQGGRITLDLGGRLTLWEMEREPLITPQLVQMQKALNLALSVLPRSVVTSGFLERVILNASLPGEWQTDSNGVKIRFIPDRMQYGPGVTTSLAGLEVEDEATGKTTTMTPDMKWKEPSTLDAPISGVRAMYESMLEEGNQSHVLMNKDAAASGASREMARKEFESDLGLTVSRVQECGSWLLETALAMAEMFCGIPGHYTDVLKVVFTCRVDAGAVDAQERESNLKLFQGGMMARETAMALNNVQDVDAEIALIEAEPGGNLSLLTRQAEAMKAFAGSGADVYGAAIVAGLSEIDAELLAGTSDNEPQIWGMRGEGVPLPSGTGNPDVAKDAAPGAAEAGAGGAPGAAAPFAKPPAPTAPPKPTSAVPPAMKALAAKRAAQNAAGGKPRGDMRNKGIKQ